MKEYLSKIQVNNLKNINTACNEQLERSRAPCDSMLRVLAVCLINGQYNYIKGWSNDEQNEQNNSIFHLEDVSLFQIVLGNDTILNP